jgi:hypothetical protein
VRCARHGRRAIEPRPLRGLRYLSGGFGAGRFGQGPFGESRSAWLTRALTDELPYLDYAGTLDWYIAHTERLTRREAAFLACNDRYWLLVELLGRHDLLHPWLFERCREVERAPDGYLDLWSRDHYKSTICTFAGIIQEILCDPELTVSIFSHKKPIATAFLAQIKRELETNETLKQLYADVLWAEPAKEAPQWSEQEGIIVKRATNPKEASVEAHGLVDSQPTSRHYGLLVYDDVVTEKSVTTPEMIRKTTERWELSDNLGSSRGARKWHQGTRQHWGDTYGIILARGALKPRIHPATDNGRLDGSPVFLTQARWEEKKKVQRSTIAAQMLLDPRAGNEQTFRPEWLKSYEVRPTYLNVYILCDPSLGQRRKRSDRTAIAVIGIDVAGNKYLLDGVRHRMKLAERYGWLKQLYNYWSTQPGVQVCLIGYERYGFQTDVETIEEYQRRDNWHAPIEELASPQDQAAHSKRDRIERLEPDVRRGSFLLPAVVHHPEFGGKDGAAIWRVWSDADAAKAASESRETSLKPGEIAYSPLLGLTRLQRSLQAAGELYRIVKAIRRLDEDRIPYDLTRAFIEEALFHPFAPHEDLLDAASRVYDMQPTPAQKFEGRAGWQPEAHPDA